MKNYSFLVKDSFFILIALSFLHHFWLDSGTYFTIGLISVLFLFAAKGRERNSLEKQFLWMFLIAIFGMVVMSLTHFDLLPENINQYGKSIGKLFFIAAVPFLLDAVSFQVRTSKFNIVRFCRVCLFGLTISVIGRIFFVYYTTYNSSIYDIFWTSNRIAFLANGMNPNSADDLFLIHFALVFFFISILYSERKLDFASLAAGTLVGAYMLLSFMVAGSRGGQLGFLVALFFIFLLFGLKKRQLVFPGVVLFFTCGLALNLNSLVPQFADNLTKIYAVNANVESYDYTELANAESFVNKNPKELGSIKRSEILQVCSPILRNEHQRKYPFVDASSAYRLSGWSYGVQIWLQKPFFGHGEFNRIRFATDYEFVSKCHILAFSHVHSFYLDLLIRGGLFIFLIFISIFFYIFFILIKNINFSNRTNLIGISPIFYFIYLLTENIFDLTMIYHTQLIGYTISFVLMSGIFLGYQNK